ncbi:golgin subfamily A member 4 isoform X2 [Trichomycterus rosablanca]|uniref:golgin subfamily A member 4 isoform X2 n=1 Tax=Trichomycterus rosablanca TaxID=2290929 RepID=UPI002F34FF93
MFKKLKQKINEEQLPQKNVLSPQQAQMSLGAKRGKPPGLHQDPPSCLSDKEREEPQSLAQKLQQRVSSVESLFRGSVRAEGIFRSGSRDSLVRSASRDSLNILGENDFLSGPSYDPPSDIESEAEEAPANTETFSKEQLLHCLHRVEKSLATYRGKYSELVIAYRTVQRDKEKTQAILSQSQDKALRRIGELREELQMDQQAKKQLQEEFDAVLEEKDQIITVLQTQVALMKKRLHGDHEGSVSPKEDNSYISDHIQSISDPQSNAQGESLELNLEGSGEPGTSVELEVLHKRVQRQETLLQRCRQLIETNKERSAQLSSENEALQQQLQERLQELEKIKELHTTEKTKLITQLKDAKNLIEQLEQDKGMVIAETKRQMHETLEMKEEEIAQLRSKIKQTVAQKEGIQEQKERAEKAAFEELERALGVAQRAEESRRQHQDCMEAQIKDVEQASKKEKRILQQELTRVKEEVVNIMKRSTEDKIVEMEQLHSEALASKDQEISALINQAVEKCRKEQLQTAKEKEQQASLALEEVLLQKSALQTEGEKKARELLLELESARTRILDLESSLVKSSSEKITQTDQHSGEIEEQKSMHEVEIAAIEERHQQNLERLRAELTETLNQQHSTAAEELVQYHKSEIKSILKDKEMQFHAHVEDMNQKMLEKMDLKQTELEAMSFKLSDMHNSRQQLEEKLAAFESENESAQKEIKLRLNEEQLKLQSELENIKHQHEQSFKEMEKTFKEELNQLNLALKEKDKELEQYVLQERILLEDATKAQQNVERQLGEMEELRHIAQSERDALAEANAQLITLREEIEQAKNELQNAQKLLDEIRNECKRTQNCLQQKTDENKELQQKVQQAMNDMTEKENSHAEMHKTMQEEQNCLKKQLDEEKCAYEKRFKQKAKEMQEKLKKKLEQREENYKAELVKRDKDLQQKEQQVMVLEMTQANTESLSSAVSDMEANHKEQLEKLREVHKQKQKELLCYWQEKLSQQEKELKEKHLLALQENVQELEGISQKLLTSIDEKELVVKETKNLREELAIRETTVQKLHAELRDAAVKLENLSGEEDMLKKQLETMEKNLNQALNERNNFQDLLCKVEDTSKERIQALSEDLEDTYKKLNVLETSRCKEDESMHTILEEKTIELETKEREFVTQISNISKELENHCQGAQVVLNDLFDDLYNTLEAKVMKLQNKITYSQAKLCNFKKVIVTKNEKICCLETELQQAMEESHNLKNALNQLASQLSALTLEKETLQKDSNNHSQLLSEKVACIEKLNAENKNLSNQLESNTLHISHLENIIDDLKKQLTEKEEAISMLNHQHNEEKQSQMEDTVQKVENEKRLALESKVQNQTTVEHLQCKILDTERQIAEKDEHLQRLTASIENQSISKSEMDQVLSEKEQRVSALTLELDNCTRRVIELEVQLEQQAKKQEQELVELQQNHGILEREKTTLIEQLQQAKEQRSQKNDLEIKLHSLEREVKNTKQELESQQKDFEREKAYILKSQAEALKAAEESAGKAAELKRKAEQKISSIRKQLTSQIEQKEQTIKDMQVHLDDISQRQNQKEQQMKDMEKNVKVMEEIINNLRKEHTKLMEPMEQQLVQQHNETQDNQNSLQIAIIDKKLTAKKFAEDETDAVCRQMEGEALTRLREVEARLAESEKQNIAHQAKIGDLKTELFKQTALVQELQKTCLEVNVKEKNDTQIEQCSVRQTASLLQIDPVRAKDKKEEPWIENELKIQDLNRKIEEKNDQLKAQENLQMGLSKSESEHYIPESRSPENHLQRKLVETENEKKKMSKDYAQLQKDLRSLRKEHEKELEYLRKEMAEENAKKIKLDIEDLDMKHNSALKQMMREFNTQMALKEKELQDSVREAIEKAQSVEAELIRSHQEEASQLQIIIGQKEDDIKKTVQRYEQVLQSREEEMGTRVCEVQNELEELRQRSQSAPKVQLAAKTTLLSEARLKEQEYQDRIHTLEDTIRGAYKNSVVTHLGTTYNEPSHYPIDSLTEPAEFEYLRKVMFEYMMGRETKTMAKVITSMLRFPLDQAQKVLEHEDARVMSWPW